MEIRTTIVKFNLPRSWIARMTDKELSIELEGQDKWYHIPRSKLNITEEMSNSIIIEMPKWLYMKGCLPLYTEVIEEYTDIHFKQ